MRHSETIGIVGAAGDLGSRITAQAKSWGFNVMTHDILTPRLTGAIDPIIHMEFIGKPPPPEENLEDVINGSQTLHWAAPQNALQGLDRLPKDTLLVLHDSVASNSVTAREQLLQKPGILGKIAIAHCLMNQEKSVLVANNVDGHERLSKHITELGLVPKLMTTLEHDYVMAHTQAPLALLSKVLKETLRKYANHQQFSPVAGVLLNVLEARASRWTRETVRSILSNPELPRFVDSLKGALVDGTGGDKLTYGTDDNKKPTALQGLDKMMARTHAPLILFGKVLTGPLRSYAKQGLLTSSAKDLLGAIESLESNMNSQDEAITLSNPELHNLIEDFRIALAAQ